MLLTECEGVVRDDDDDVVVVVPPDDGVRVVADENNLDVDEGIRYL